MQIAKMLLLNYRPDITSGTENVMAILFDMNTLWEEWVYRRLKREEGAFSITVLRQQSTDFWKGEHLPRHKTIRPDIVIKTADGKTIIIDTKWKLVNDLTPADDDLKQMFVYNLYWQCSQSILLYPATDEGASRLGNYVQLPQLGGASTSCRIITQSIFKDGKIDADFGKRILATALQDLMPFVEEH
jgi:5-methylcytosine-specific restriction enzyme subunit McrC